MVILASQSPRRKALMALLGIPFTVRLPSADETMAPGDDPAHQVALVSQRKALAVARQPEDIVIGADTVVVSGREILGKPRDRTDAVRMLKLLSGSTHRVMTGVTVLRGETVLTDTVVTHVTFRDLTDAEIEAYADTGEPMDKAGAYGIQGYAAVFVREIQGDYYNVVGLPVCRLTTMLRELERA